MSQILRDENGDNSQENMDDFGSGGADDGDAASDRKVWLESKHCKSYLLIKLQQAFCMR